MSKTKAVAQTETETKDKAETIKKPSVVVARKLSVATVFGKVKIADIPEDGQIHLMRIAGVASEIDSGESSYGAWACLKGDFAAINYITGERFVGASAFVPGAMGEMLIEQVRSGLRNDVGFALKFSVDVFAVVSPRDANKYEYVVKPVIESTAGNQALLLLEMSK